MEAIGGSHHVTAVTGRVAENHAFYAGVLGMKLVKKTVNQDAAAQLAWRERLVAAGLPVSEVIDRFYFRAMYFREPGGVLFEISTSGPGFAADEDAAHLGETLSLPPFLESRRAAIEARPAPLRTAEVNR